MLDFTVLATVFTTVEFRTIYHYNFYGMIKQPMFDNFLVLFTNAF